MKYRQFQETFIGIVVCGKLPSHTIDAAEKAQLSAASIICTKYPSGDAA